MKRRYNFFMFFFVKKKKKRKEISYELFQFKSYSQFFLHIFFLHIFFRYMKSAESSLQFPFFLNVQNFTSTGVQENKTMQDSYIITFTKKKQNLDKRINPRQNTVCLDQQIYSSPDHFTPVLLVKLETFIKSCNFITR